LKHWAYYRPSGVIQFVSPGPDDAAPVPVPGLLVIECDPGVNGTAHHVAGGGIVAGLIDDRTLEQRKAERWEAMKVARDAAIDAPLVTPYGTFDSGPADRTNITDAVLMLQTLAAQSLPAEITFTLADNTTVLLGVADMVHVGLLLGAKVQAAHARGRDVRAAIDAATTPAQVDAVTW
jgi:hypothetical protein